MSYLGRILRFDGYYGLGDVRVKSYSPNKNTYTVVDIRTGKEMTLKEEDVDFIVKNYTMALEWQRCVCGAEATDQPGHSDWCNKFNPYI